MERVSAADDRSSAPVEMIRSIEKLATEPTDLVGGAGQAALDAAHANGIAAVRSALSRQLSIDLERSPGDDVAGREFASADGRRPELQTGSFVEAAALADVLASVVEAAQRGASSRGDDTPSLVFASVEDTRVPAAAARSAQALMSMLDEGWMAVAEAPRGLGAGLDRLLADLAYVFASPAPLLFVGMRSALGPPGRDRSVPTLVMQIHGRRSVSIHGAARSSQHQVGPGAAFVLPPATVAAHLPLDSETAHLEIELSIDRAAPANAALTPTVRIDDPMAARAALQAGDDGWPMRLRAPGGAQLLQVGDGGGSTGDPGDEAVVAIGGRRIVVSSAGLALIEALLAGDYVRPGALAARLGVDPPVVAQALRRLRDVELLDPAPVAESIRANDRLTQVASAQLGSDAAVPFIAAARAGGWRVPEPGEVPPSPHLNIAVQTLDPTAGRADALLGVVLSLNEQFLGVQLRPDLAEPLVLVRVRPGAATQIAGPPRTAHLASDLLGASTRKLTFVLSLTSDADGRGGWVHLPGGSDTADPTVGALSVWASFRPWSLQPFDAGERLLLLGRAHGPAYA